jgi:hypothetical protein
MLGAFTISLRAMFVDKLTKVQSHAEMLEHPYRGHDDLEHVFFAQLLFVYKDKTETTQFFI